MRVLRKSLAYSILGLLFATSLPPSGEAQSPSSYRIGPKDLLEIRVDEVPDMTRQERVSDNGTISIPLVGTVSASGKTQREVEEELKRLLEANLLQKATVLVLVKEFNSKPISVTGAVERPGNLGFSGRWTLLEALAAAGGMTAQRGSTIYVLRRAENGLSSQIEIPVRELMDRANPIYNIPIFANDLIRVAVAEELKVFFLGEVAQPGAITFRDTECISLLTAIASAGGLTDRASSKILIRRSIGPGESTREIEADFKAIQANRAPDPPLENGDVIIVKESFF